EAAEEGSTRAGIERSGGLVKQQELLRQDQCARQVHLLLFATRKGGGIGAPEFWSHAELVEPVAGLVERLGLADASQAQRLGDDVLGGNAWAGVEELGNEADFLTA